MRPPKKLPILHIKCSKFKNNAHYYNKNVKKLLKNEKANDIMFSHKIFIEEQSECIIQR